MASIKDEILKIPPVTRFLCGSLVVVTLPMLLAIVPIHNLIFTNQIVKETLQIWRAYTTFFIAGSGINFIFDLAMFYRNSEQLEVNHYAGRSADLAWQLFLACVTILTINIPLVTMVHTRALLLALVYMLAALAPAGSQTSFFGIITIPVVYLPYLLIFLDLISSGPRAAAVSTSGAIVGHLWWWGLWDTGALREWGKAPDWLARMMGQRGGPQVNTGGGVYVTPPRREEAAPTGVHNWGSGRKLGTS